MNRLNGRLAHLFTSLVLAVGLLIWFLLLPQKLYSQPAPLPQNKVDLDLIAEMESSQAYQSVRFIVRFQTTAVSALKIDGTTENEQRTSLVNQLQQTAAASQANALTTLDNLAAAGNVTAVHPLWIVNSIAATGNYTAVQTLASLPEVVQVRLDTIVQQIGPSDALTPTLQAVNTAVVTGPVASWGIDKINAPAVWHGLGIDGSGVVVAIMDTGVDWQHPDLAENYRGNQSGTVDHSGSWFDAVVPTNTVPVDNMGHGTHVAGTAVGQNGIGVAPGANWIAVNVASPLGFIWESDVHRGFEWLLAPNGDVSLAPNVINNSWGSTIPNTVFVDDIAALQAANIKVVFSAGNSGPFSGSIGYPAGYPDVLAVGASDEIDEVAWFSSRGPSSQTNQQKPWLVAPGWQIWSAQPDGTYGLNSGTSMAAPHVTGAIALLLSANPNLTRTEVNQILADTAVPLSAPQPNNDSGWGRLDVYAAVASQTSAGSLTGQLLAAGLPLPHAVVTITTPSGAQLPFVTDGNGRYTAKLQSGNYTLTSQPFGYTQTSITGVMITNGQTTTRNITVNLLPNGRVEGTVRAVAGYVPLTNAKIEVVGTPITAMTDGNGRFDLTLPTGSYQLIVSKTSYQQQQAEIWLGVGTAVVQNFYLADAPAVLLVDSGHWYFSSQTAPYVEALNTLNYSFDTWTVRNPLTDAPALDDLTPYDAVVWSNPQDSPGYLGVNNVITDYLGLGGHLFISGQNIGAYDGEGFYTQLWWYRDLGANFLGKTAVTNTISGSSDSLFSGLSFNLNGGSSSNNQVAPDVSAPRINSFAEPAFVYEDGRAAGLTSGYCTPFRLVYLGFGLEGVPEAADRAAILRRSFTYFDQPREQVGVQLFPDSIDELAIPGEQMAYDIQLLNRSESLTDTFTLSISGADWPTSLLTKTMTLGPCQISQTVLTLDIPPDLPPDVIESLRVTAVSSNNPAFTDQLVVQHKIPGNILFVDDDRWYDQTAELTAALDSIALTYDTWDTGHANSISRNGPPLALLKQYDFVIWYTGYDWFQPITAAENQALTDYLAQGGRLFLTSQDFLYYHHNTALAREYFGVADYEESVEPTQLIGSGHTAVSAEAMPPIPLDFTPYQNHADGIVPSPDSQPFFWHDRALPAGTATSGNSWRAIFWAVPFETITPTRQAEVMNRVMGWLSDLGDSSFTVDQRVGLVGEPHTYTITVRQIANGLSNSVALTNTLSNWLQLDPASVTGGAIYNPTTRQLTWSGTLPSGDSHSITYQATPTGPLPWGEMLENVLDLHDGRHNLTFTRKATIWVNAPEVIATITAVPNQPIAANIFTYTFGLQNVGLAPTSQISTVVSLPNTFYILTDTLTSTAGSAAVGDRRLYWSGDLAVAQSVTMTLVLTREMTAVPQWVATTVLVDDGVTTPAFFAKWEFLPVYSQYMPLIFLMKDP